MIQSNNQNSFASKWSITVTVLLFGCAFMIPNTEASACTDYLSMKSLRSMTIGAGASTSVTFNIPSTCTKVRVQGVGMYSTDGSGFTLLVQPTATSTTYYPSSSTSETQASTCFYMGDTAQIITTKTLAIVVKCLNYLYACPLRYDWTISCEEYATPPASTPNVSPNPDTSGSTPNVSPNPDTSGSNSASTSGCRCTCCRGNFCSASYIGVVAGSSSTCSSSTCDQSQCASAFPSSCPAPGTSGSSGAACSRVTTNSAGSTDFGTSTSTTSSTTKTIIIAVCAGIGGLIGLICLGIFIYYAKRRYNLKLAQQSTAEGQPTTTITAVQM